MNAAENRRDGDTLQTLFRISMRADVGRPYHFTPTASHQAAYRRSCDVGALRNSGRLPRVRGRSTDPKSRGAVNERRQEKKTSTRRVYASRLDRCDRRREADGFVKVPDRTGTDKILGVTTWGKRATDDEYVSNEAKTSGMTKIWHDAYLPDTGRS